MRGKLRKGLPISDHHVFGYDWHDGNYIINPVQADIVRQCFAMYINANGGYRFIIDWLESQGIPSPKGAKRWSDYGMMRLLKRQMYTGEYFSYQVYNKKISAKKFDRKPRDESEWIPMQCPAIIDKETFEKAQAKLERNKQQRIRETKHPYLLAGVLYCGCCGRKIRPAHEPLKYGMYFYYQCNAVSLKDRSCTNHSVSSDVVDTMVWEKLKQVCRNETMLKRYIQQNQPKQKDNTEAIKKELDAIETKRQAIMNWFSANLISAEESTQKLQALKKQEQNLTEKLVTKKEDIPTDEIVKDAKKKITFEEKRNFILQHIKKVILLRKDFDDVHDIDLEITIIFRS
jgi:site-specific DNA recombinase